MPAIPQNTLWYAISSGNAPGNHTCFVKIFRSHGNNGIISISAHQQFAFVNKAGQVELEWYEYECAS